MNKVLIMTLEQGTNYGGMLQAYALQRALSDIGVSAESSFSPGSLHKRLIKSTPGSSLLVAALTGKQPINKKKVSKNTRVFVEDYVKIVSYRSAVRRSRQGIYHAYIAGSDQVWRQSYANVPRNLFSFVKDNKIKLSYAASFGQDDLSEYGEALIRTTRKLAEKFAEISVREDSGVDIVKEHWGRDAVQHVDPTLLLNSIAYSDLINSSGTKTSAPEGDLFSYVLDIADSKQSIAQMVAAHLGLKTFKIINGDENGGDPMPPVEQWLRSFRDSQFVVTDSFHGMVFAIIFNKPFVAIGNKGRGLARFSSLLKVLGIEDRLVTSPEDVTEELVKKKIDWSQVNKKIGIEQDRAYSYLKHNLNSRKDSGSL